MEYFSVANEDEDSRVHPDQADIGAGIMYLYGRWNDTNFPEDWLLHRQNILKFHSSTTSLFSSSSPHPPNPDPNPNPNPNPNLNTWSLILCDVFFQIE